MFKLKNNYTERLKLGIPKVISYQHSVLEVLDFKFHKEVEAITYDRKDIYDSSGNVDKIDISKAYISAFDL
jgi:hypothetical protein